MKQLIAFGMALVLLFVAGAPAYTQEGATPAEAQPFVAPSENDIDPIAEQRRMEDPFDLNGVVAPHRPWCRNSCSARQYRDILVPGDASEGCSMYQRSQSRCLIKQRAWPSCACVYTDWYGDSDVCIG